MTSALDFWGPRWIPTRMARPSISFRQDCPRLPGQHRSKRTTQRPIGQFISGTDLDVGDLSALENSLDKVSPVVSQDKFPTDIKSGTSISTIILGIHIDLGRGLSCSTVSSDDQLTRIHLGVVELVDSGVDGGRIGEGHESPSLGSGSISVVLNLCGFHRKSGIREEVTKTLGVGLPAKFPTYTVLLDCTGESVNRFVTWSFFKMSDVVYAMERYTVR